MHKEVPSIPVPLSRRSVSGLCAPDNRTVYTHPELLYLALGLSLPIIVHDFILEHSRRLGNLQLQCYTIYVSYDNEKFYPPCGRLH